MVLELRPGQDKPTGLESVCAADSGMEVCPQEHLNKILLIPPPLLADGLPIGVSLPSCLS